MGQPSSNSWAIARRQHGVVARRQLFELGYSAKAIDHGIAKGRLHVIYRGVYAVGRPTLTQHGRWMAAVLSCGGGAFLSHESAAALWMLISPGRGPIHVSVFSCVKRSRPGVVVHRRYSLEQADVTRHEGIPVSTPICTLIDAAANLGRNRLEGAVNEADKCDLADPEELRAALDTARPRPGFRALRELLDKPIFTLTDSELERLFLPIAERAGLGQPLTRCQVNGFRVDFFWPSLGLVVETDGLRYHRTPMQQARDRERDQAHVVAGLTPLRFTRAQVRFERHKVEATLTAVADRLRSE
jgi:hypothetical protein